MSIEPSHLSCPVDKCYRWLHLLGWSVGDVAFVAPDGGRQWWVTCRRGGQVIIARAPAMRMAWNGALRMAGVVKRGG